MKCAGKRDRAKVPAAAFEVRPHCRHHHWCDGRGHSVSGLAAFSGAAFRALREGFSTRPPFVPQRSLWFVIGICARPEIPLLDALPCACRVECRLARAPRGQRSARASCTNSAVGGAGALSNRMTAINPCGPAASRLARVTTRVGVCRRVGHKWDIEKADRPIRRRRVWPSATEMS